MTGTSRVIDSRAGSSQTLPVTVLVVCPNEERLSRLKDAIHAAGFRLISAKALDEAWAKSDFFDFGAVVLDYELRNDIAASAFRRRFITLNLNEHCPPDAVGLELSEIFHRVSELVH